MIVPRASAPAPVDVPTPPPTLRYAAAAAVAIPKPEQPAEVVSITSISDSQSINPTSSRNSTVERKPPVFVASPPLSQATPSFPSTQVSAYAAQDPILPLPLPEVAETKMPPALADLVASFDSTKAKGRYFSLIFSQTSRSKFCEFHGRSFLSQSSRRS
jgi:hypothetical protein